VSVRTKLERVLHRKVVNVPLYIIGICGLAGVLIDIDHPISYWITGEARRADHIPLGIISCVILCGVSTYCRRFYNKSFLRELIYWSVIILLVLLGIWIFSNKMKVGMI
jgi:hypothetical protein